MQVRIQEAAFHFGGACLCPRGGQGEVFTFLVYLSDASRCPWGVAVQVPGDTDVSNADGGPVRLEASFSPPALVKRGSPSWYVVG